MTVTKETDFTSAIGKAGEKDDEALFAFYFSLRNKNRKEDPLPTRKKVFAPYLKPFFPSIGFTPYTEAERQGKRPKELLRESYYSFCGFVHSRYLDIPSLFASVRLLLTYLERAYEPLS